MAALQDTAREARESYAGGESRRAAWRLKQLRALHALVQDNERRIFAALMDDLGKHRVEAFRDEVGIVLQSITTAIHELKKWMLPEKAAVPLAAILSTAEIVPEPLGVVLIISCWNFPLGLALKPLIGAVAAGNAVVLKPSELAPATAELLAVEIPKYMDGRFVKVVLGGPDVGQQLLEQRWDKILFTGSQRVGRIVMAAAAKHLTPVALELGGKCPAIFDRLKCARDRRVAVDRIAGAKWGPCGGQACIAVDYILVEAALAPTLIGLLVSSIRSSLTEPEYMARIVNEKHFQRLRRWLESPGVANSIVHGGGTDSDKLRIEPTILLDPPLESEMMTEEIFGPLLPIITLNSIGDSIRFIQERPRPMVIYAFTDDAKLRARIVEETSSGSVTFNDAVVQYAMETLPFGGVGECGFGQYHGKFSFDMFSHRKPVLRRWFLVELSMRYPPWSERKLTLLRHLYRFDYLRFVLCFIGLDGRTAVLYFVLAFVAAALTQAILSFGR